MIYWKILKPSYLMVFQSSFCCHTLRVTFVIKSVLHKEKIEICFAVCSKEIKLHGLKQ